MQAPKKSAVWTYFKRGSSGEEVVCLKCKRQLKFSGNTSNMKKHLMVHHPLIFRVITMNTKASSLQEEDLTDEESTSTR